MAVLWRWNWPNPPFDLMQRDLDMRFTGITDSGDWSGVVISGGSIGTQWEYVDLEQDINGYAHVPIRLPFELWDVENNRQINCATINRNSDGECPYGDGVGDPNTPGLEPRWRFRSGDYLIPIFSDYDPLVTHYPNDSLATWFLGFRSESATWSTGDVYRITTRNRLSAADRYHFTPSSHPIEGDVMKIRGFKLNQNYPNSFNSSTLIAFDLASASRVILKIYNTLGQQVLTLTDDRFEPGYHTVIWNGIDAGRRPVSSGIYLYRLQVDEYVTMRKMVLMR